MSGRVFAILVSIFVALLAWAAGPAMARDDFRSGVWEGHAHPRDGGPFTHCSIGAEYENGIILFFFVTRRHDFGVLLSSNAWSLNKGDRYDVAFRIDGGPRIKTTALAISQHSVNIDLPNNGEMFNSLRAGSALLIVAAGGRFRFDLGGTSAALLALLDCVNRNVQTAGSGRPNPFSGSAPERPQARTDRPAPRNQGEARQPPQASPAARAKAASFVEKLLLRAELYDYEILSGGRVPAELRRYDVVWKGYHVVGVLDIIPPEAFRSVDEVATATVRSYQQACDGKLSSKGQEIRLDNTRKAIQIAVACAGKVKIFVDYTVMPLNEGGFYRIMHLSSADPEAGHAANERIGAALPLMLAGK